MGLLSSIGGLIGLAVGGPLGAALGSGIGSLAGGGDIGDALKAGVLGFGIGSIPGAQGFVQGAAGSLGLNALAGGAGGQAGGGSLAALLGGGGGAGGTAAAQTAAAAGGGAAVNPIAALTGGAAGGGAGLGGGIMGFAQQNPLIMAALMQAAEPSQDMLSPEQERQLATGERLPDYRGTAAPDYRMRSRNFAMGGFIEGPGTGTSDSIPGKIYQNGGPVQEAMLSDGEFVMTADAVRGMGNGNRNAGAAKMYEMMNRLERRA
jgi:hypothetical protein